MYGWLLLQRARWWGRRDGKLEHPSPTDPGEVPGEVSGIARRGAQHLAQIAGGWHRRDRRLKGRECQLRAELAKAQAASERAGADLEQARGTLASRRAEGEADRSERRAGGDKTPDARMGRRTYHTGLAVLSVGEMFLNSQVLLVLGLTQAFTLIMTVVVVGILVGLAHVLGVFLRKDRLTPTERVLRILLVVAPFVYAVLAGTIRGGYARATDAADVFGLSPTAVAITLGGLNVLFYFVAALLSYLAHHPGQDEVRSAEREVAVKERALRGANRTVERIARAHARPWSQRQGVWEATIREAERHASFYRQMLFAYVAGNVRRRTDHAVAASLKPQALPDIPLPQSLAGPLDWGCRGTEPVVVVVPEADREASPDGEGTPAVVGGHWMP